MRNHCTSVLSPVQKTFTSNTDYTEGHQEKMMLKSQKFCYIRVVALQIIPTKISSAYAVRNCTSLDSFQPTAFQTALMKTDVIQ